MKELLDLDLVGGVVFLSYLLLFFLGYIIVLNQNKILTINILFLSSLSFAIPLLFYGFNQIYNFKSIPPDTLVYHDLISDFSNNFDKYSFGVYGYALLNYIPFKLCFGMPAIFIPFNILYYNLGVLFIHKAFCSFLVYSNISFNRKRIFQFSLLLSIIYPIALIHNSSILREGFLLLLFSINIYFITHFYCNNYQINVWKLIFAILFLFFLFIVRPIVAFSLLAVYIVTYSKIKKLITLRNLVKLIFILLLGFYVLKLLAQSVYNTTFDLDWIIRYRVESVLNFGSEGYNLLVWDTVFNYLVNPFLLFFQFLLSPLPILVNIDVTMNKVIPFIDSVFIIFFILLPVIIFFRKKFIYWYLLFFIITIISALLETNISGAYRHRMISIITLIPLVSFFFSKFIIFKDVN